MHFAIAITALLSAAAVQGANITVKVGANNGLVFDPTSVTAAAGDTISFQFQGKNHSVTQSTFASPCVHQGVDSGFMFVASGATNLPQWSINIENTTTPLWFFCAQTNPASHCQKGMVFAVNPSTDKTFAQFQANAMGGSSSASAGASGTPAAGTPAAGTPAASGTAPATTSTSAQGSGALRIGGSAAGFLTAAALLVGIAL